MDERLKRHALTDEEWARLERCCRRIRVRVIGGLITDW
jgi:hypothetical protein